MEMSRLSPSPSWHTRSTTGLPVSVSKHVSKLGEGLGPHIPIPVLREVDLNGTTYLNLHGNNIETLGIQDARSHSSQSHSSHSSSIHAHAYTSGSRNDRRYLELEYGDDSDVGEEESFDDGSSSLLLDLSSLTRIDLSSNLLVQVQSHSMREEEIAIQVNEEEENDDDASCFKRHAAVSCMYRIDNLFTLTTNLEVLNLAANNLNDDALARLFLGSTKQTIEGGEQQFFHKTRQISLRRLRKINLSHNELKYGLFSTNKASSSMFSARCCPNVTELLLEGNLLSDMREFISSLYPLRNTLVSLALKDSSSVSEHSCGGDTRPPSAYSCSSSTNTMNINTHTHTPQRNKMCNSDGYRQVLVRFFAKLEVLDGTVVTERERRDAVANGELLFLQQTSQNQNQPVHAQGAGASPDENQNLSAATSSKARRTPQPTRSKLKDSWSSLSCRNDKGDTDSCRSRGVSNNSNGGKEKEHSRVPLSAIGRTSLPKHMLMTKRSALAEQRLRSTTESLRQTTNEQALDVTQYNRNNADWKEQEIPHKQALRRINKLESQIGKMLSKSVKGDLPSLNGSDSGCLGDGNGNPPASKKSQSLSSPLVTGSSEENATIIVSPSEQHKAVQTEVLGDNIMNNKTHHSVVLSLHISELTKMLLEARREARVATMRRAFCHLKQITGHDKEREKYSLALRETKKKYKTQHQKFLAKMIDLEAQVSRAREDREKTDESNDRKMSQRNAEGEKALEAQRQAYEKQKEEASSKLQQALESNSAREQDLVEVQSKKANVENNLSVARQEIEDLQNMRNENEKRARESEVEHHKCLAQVAQLQCEAEQAKEKAAEEEIQHHEAVALEVAKCKNEEEKVSVFVFVFVSDA
jgi:hypothetical protein